MFDLIALNHNGLTEPEVKCLDHGFVRLVDSMPRLTYSLALNSCDFAVVQAARTSTGLGVKTPKEDESLIRYLMRNRHTSPFEQVEFKFHCAMPIFVARQWVRHRMASLNEFSGRYTELPDKFYIPKIDAVRKQSSLNKQGSEGIHDVELATAFLEGLRADCEQMYSKYIVAKDQSIARELARIGLPVNLYTQWYWKIDLKNLLDFLALRCDTHAQYEIRVFADALLQLIAPMVPYTVRAWEHYNPMRQAMLLTAGEIESLRSANGHPAETIEMSNREKNEWEAKKIRLGLNSPLKDSAQPMKDVS